MSGHKQASVEYRSDCVAVRLPISAFYDCRKDSTLSEKLYNLEVQICFYIEHKAYSIDIWDGLSKASSESALSQRVPVCGYRSFYNHVMVCVSNLLSHMENTNGIRV